MLTRIGAAFDALGAVSSLDPQAIAAQLTAPEALATAVTILVLATISDALGNSPVLFFTRMSRGRLLVAFAIEIVLSLLGLALWLVSFWILALVLNEGVAQLSNVVLVVGLGYAPMLLGCLVLIPTFGPFLGRVLLAWTLVTMTATFSVAAQTPTWSAVAAPLLATLLLLLVRRSSNRLSVALLGSLARRLTGVDLMRRTRALDPAIVLSRGEQVTRG